MVKERHLANGPAGVGAAWIRDPARVGPKRKTWPVFALALLITLLIIRLPVVGAAQTVTDLSGRRVRLPDRPARIVSLAPSVTEMIFALGLGHRLVGATQFSDYPADARALPRIGSYVNLNIEKIVALGPDLCIAVKDGNPIAAVSKLEALDIPVYAVDPRSLGDVMETLEALGRVLAATDRATAIVRGMRTRIDQVRQCVAGASRRPTVFVQIGIAPIVSVGTPTLLHELIGLAGGFNLAQGQTPYPRFSREEVIVMRPEILIITSMARRTVFEQVKVEWEAWRDMPAVKDGRIHLVDSDVLDRPTPRLVDGLELLAGLIHPDRFRK